MFWKMWKVIVLFCPFFGRIWLMFKKHCKKRCFSTFSKAKKRNKWPFCKVIIWAKLMLLSGPSLLQHKNGQLGPDNNFANYCAHFFFKKSAETPIFIVFLCKQCFFVTKLAQIITLENPKLGPDTNFTAYIYIYAVGSIIWPPQVNNLATIAPPFLLFVFKIFFFLQGEWDFCFFLIKSFEKHVKTSRSITWPPFPLKILAKMWPS